LSTCTTIASDSSPRFPAASMAATVYEWVPSLSGSGSVKAAADGVATWLPSRYTR
jgi:hypothetical protein